MKRLELGRVDTVEPQTALFLIQDCSLGAILGCGDLSDEEWAVIKTLLPSERGRKARPAHDNLAF
jgi:hypothetical protein